MKIEVNIIVAILSLSIAMAQQSYNASGAMALGKGGSVSYSVGQITYQIHTGVNNVVLEGVQQPYEISIESDTVDHEKNKSLFVVEAYPNPVINLLTLVISDSDYLNLSYKLYDVGGKLVLYDNISGNVTDISTRNLVNGVFALKINKRNKILKTLKIIKRV